MINVLIDDSLLVRLFSCLGDALQVEDLRVYLELIDLVAVLTLKYIFEGLFLLVIELLGRHHKAM